MTIKVKICGLSTPESVRAAGKAGATYMGFVFYPPSPRHIPPEQAAELTAHIPPSVIKVGVFVTPDDDQLEHILRHIPLNLIQLHGTETPKRVLEIKKRFALPVMKAIGVSDRHDIDRARNYENVADMLLFDTKAPISVNNTRPGGRGVSFDWQLIKGTDWAVPWMLSGGLNEDNILTAIAITGARIVDVSSGVESRPGEKNNAKITAFMRCVHEQQ